MREYTKCDAVMIGRGALGNPWIFRNILDEIFSEDYKINNLDTVKKTCIEHIKLLIENKAEKVSVGLSKKHLSWYLKGFKNSSNLRKEIMHRKEIMYCNAKM